MMKKYNVTVNGNTYEVEVEEVTGENTYTAVETSQPIKKAAPQPVKKEVKSEPKAAAPVAVPAAPVAAGEKVECPMPGTILKIDVNVGDSVKKGDVLLILEAMKMENEIMAPHDAKILQVVVTKGASVDTGDLLIVLG